MSNLRPESHVAQQIRREKLRIQNSSQPSHEFPNNLEQLSLHPAGGFNNLDLLQVRSVRNANILDGLAVYSSEMPNFSTSSSNPNLSDARNALEYHQEQGAAAEPSNRLMMNQYGSFPHSMSAIHSSHKEHCELRNLGNWRNSAPHQGSDWFVNYASNANSFLSADLNNNVSAYNELMDVHCSNASGEISGREIQKQLGVLHNNPPPSPLYQNALQDIVKSASFSSHTRQDMSSLMQQNDHSIWVGNAGEAEPQQPSYENQPNQLHFGWTNRTIANTLSDSTPQSLSLSLSSNAQPKPSVSHLEQGSASDDPQCLTNMKSIVKPSIVSRDIGKSVQETVGMPSKSTITYRSVGPLGPFTGYATILKSSRFLKSAQQLLDEICCLSGAKFAKSYDVSKRVSPEVSASTSADTVTGVAAKGSNSGSSSSILYSVSKENRADPGVRSSFGLSSRPDYQHKKAKLLYMQEEVTRQCKQYHLQMQMVVSSFESVAGLGSATPYIPMALKSVSKHFRCFKNSISEQLKLISEALGEDLSKPSNTSTCSNKADTTTTKARIRCSIDQSFLKNKSVKGTTELLEQHVWRPQRGLPERAVAILKAWLFEHFLHPYPTDTDKHMLASQTGLSRNQVSNWFINARVRVWKPMVEEIHTLETKATSSKGNCGKNEGTSSGTEGDTSHPRALSNIGMNSIPENQFQGMDMGSSIIAANAEESGLNSEQWSQEKRSKLECQMTTSNMDGTLMGFVPYRRGGGIEVGGLGSVSLTLGLRHGVEGVQHQQQLQEEQLRHHLGGHMIHDFVG
ncbi:BEL1-like homeodomain protein 4 [Glycine soja]|uniref:BEL1-like homeodomain protein 8 isoform A n=1 Tax=Glycine soja TaxID=3848 RepID=A0A445HRU5_GLYSO|nr:BEL1-like homeodomain protein 4 [Glycine soja]XP_028193694.1 BEL1-like homeodomain protein 4 [Glycine soja]RZB76370.1 BEL1-like homeodomain protein 8 isoform A [Glycine soja]RZB76371.1 BEL1-like homeodomain protein 8 isoform B [Glycine soja]